MNALKEYIARNKPRDLIDTEASKLGFDGVLKHILPEGMLLEFGVFEGKSFNQICDLVAPRKVYGFDSFYGLDEDWIDRGRMSTPRGGFNRNGVPPEIRDNGELVIGRVQDTLGDFIFQHWDEDVAFAHLDMDLYAPTKYVLTELEALFLPGTVLLFDEYDDRAFGHDHEQKAFKEFLDESGWHAELIGKRVWNAYAFRLME